MKAGYQQILSSIVESGKKIAIFGAGHQGIMFINSFNLDDYIHFTIDDDANKQNYNLPGSDIPIVSSSILLSDMNIAACLLAVSPKIEAKIREKFAAFIDRGGKMYSIFPGSSMDTLLRVKQCA
jgi:hypothetical protein